MNVDKPKSLDERAAELYPKSPHMQAQWIQQTTALNATGKHLLYSGKFPESQIQHARISH